MSRADPAVAKEYSYYQHARFEILPLLPRRVDRLLDIGCGEGVTARYLKDQGYCDWAGGIEGSPSAAAAARSKLDYLLEGDLNTVQFSEVPSPVDVILCLDLLEHLVDPWGCVERLLPILSPGGIIVASIPNVRNFRVALPLLFQGRWDYVEAGILDSTHLRFFTRRSAIELMKSGGLTVERVQPRLGRYMRIANAATFSIFSDLLAVQFLIRARKPGSIAADGDRS